MRATTTGAALAVALLVAGCGSGGGPTADNGTSAPSPEVTTSPEPSPSGSATPSAATTASADPSVTPGGASATPTSTPHCPKRQSLGGPAPGGTSLIAAGAYDGSVSISGDGRYVAFRSDSPNVLPAGEDTNDFQDIFVTDRKDGTTKRVNLAPDGSQTDGFSSGVDISADGNWVLFVSKSPNLADGKDVGRVYLRDLRSGHTTQLPAVEANEDNPEIIGRSLSGDGRWVTFDWDEKSYLYDRTTGKNTRITGYEGAVISTDGSTIAVKDAAGKLLTVRDRAGGKVEPVSRTVDGKAPTNGRPSYVSMSDDGNLVAFVFDGPDLSGSGCTGPGIYVRDRAKGTTMRVANAPANPTYARISGDGRWLISNGSVPTKAGTRFEVLRHELSTGATTLVSVADDESLAKGEELAANDGAVSRDGRVIAFNSNATNLAPGANGRDSVFVRELD